MRRHIWLLIVNPFTSLVLLALLIVVALNIGAGSRETSVLGGFVRVQILRQSIASSPSPTPQAFFLQRNSTIRVIDEQIESWDELSRLMIQQPDSMVQVAVHTFESHSGFWAPTRFEQSWHLDWIWMGEPWTPEDQARGARALAEYLVHRRGWEPQWAVLAQDSGSQRRFMLRGYIANALTIVLLLTFLTSLAWLPCIPHWLRAANRRARHRPWKCRACGYDMRGLESDICPECGNT